MECLEPNCKAIHVDHEYGDEVCSYGFCWIHMILVTKGETCEECDPSPDPDPDGFKLSLSDLTGPEDELLHALELLPDPSAPEKEA